ncbi:hypothetical protein LCGC14_0441790 [marine sediment metagenome]|uniref:Uncharacterized protein n=1 Tax=marine sediment metagenome TaxID=412755 RepID=A0A0F9SK20_9ZZZZ
METSTRSWLFLALGTLYGVLLDSWISALLYGIILLAFSISVEIGARK